MIHRPVYYVTDAEAAAIRAWALDASHATEIPPRIWAPPDRTPIRVVEPTGRASCRVCGARIEPGERAIVFGLVSAPGARLSAAYIHATCPEEER